MTDRTIETVPEPCATRKLEPWLDATDATLWCSTRGSGWRCGKLSTRTLDGIRLCDTCTPPMTPTVALTALERIARIGSDHHGEVATDEDVSRYVRLIRAVIAAHVSVCEARLAAGAALPEEDRCVTPSPLSLPCAKHDAESGEPCDRTTP